MDNREFFVTKIGIECKVYNVPYARYLGRVVMNSDGRYDVVSAEGETLGTEEVSVALGYLGYRISHG